MIDYVCYGDTDSLYIQLYQWFIDNNVNMNKWESLSTEDKLQYVKRIAKEVEDYVNDKSINETQLLHYNSQLHDFGIVFEQEKIALTALFKQKKRYATWTLIDDGKWKDDISVTGLEIIRSDSPEIVKPMVKKVLQMILLEHQDQEIADYIIQCKKRLYKSTATEIAENKGINKIDKFQYEEQIQDNLFVEQQVSEYKWISGTPHQVKGAINYNYLLNRLNIDSKYEEVKMGNKAKVVYIKDNCYGINSLSFIEWPAEFDQFGIYIDYKKMIENNFIKKVRGLLEIVGKERLLTVDKKIVSLMQ